MRADTVKDQCPQQNHSMKGSLIVTATKDLKITNEFTTE